MQGFKILEPYLHNSQTLWTSYMYLVISKEALDICFQAGRTERYIKSIVCPDAHPVTKRARCFQLMLLACDGHQCLVHVEILVNLYIPTAFDFRCYEYNTYYVGVYVVYWLKVRRPCCNFLPSRCIGKNKIVLQNTTHNKFIYSIKLSIQIRQVTSV